jgi:membrane protein DedA with SNARE-associated domain
MAMESSIVPLPSELVIPPAAYLAYSKGSMSLAGVVLAGTLGSWLGAAVMYWASRLAGRPLVLQYGRYLGVSARKVEQAEQWSARFGSYGVFASRMIPVIRHLIGIPAGIVRLGFLKYSAYTVLGSAIWCSVLAWVGVVAGNDKALWEGDSRRIAIWLTGALLVLGTIYYLFVYRLTRKDQSEASFQPPPSAR